MYMIIKKYVFFTGLYKLTTQILFDIWEIQIKQCIVFLGVTVHIVCIISLYLSMYYNLYVLLRHVFIFWACLATIEK